MTGQRLDDISGFHWHLGSIVWPHLVFTCRNYNPQYDKNGKWKQTLGECQWICISVHIGCFISSSLAAYGSVTSNPMLKLIFLQRFPYMEDWKGFKAWHDYILLLPALQWRTDWFWRRTSLHIQHHQVANKHLYHSCKCRVKESVTLNEAVRRSYMVYFRICFIQQQWKMLKVLVGN